MYLIEITYKDGKIEDFEHIKKICYNPSSGKKELQGDEILTHEFDFRVVANSSINLFAENYSRTELMSNIQSINVEKE